MATLSRQHLVTVEPDGKFRVHRIPIFAEHVRYFAGEKHVIDAPRLDEFAQWLKDRELQDGWKPAVHAEHHSEYETGSRPRLAFATNPTLGRARLEGKIKTILYVDYLCDTADQLKELENYPYRSPQVNLELNRIGSVAVMESEEPYFHFPLFKLAQDPESFGDHKRYNAEGDGLLAFAAVGPEYSCLYRFPSLSYGYREDQMKIKYENEEENTQDEDVFNDEEYENDEEGDFGEEEEAPAEPSMDEQLEGLVKTLVPMLVPKLKKAMYEAAGLEDMEDDEYEDENMRKRQEQPVVMNRAEAESMAHYAALQGKIDALEGKFSRIEKKGAVSRAINWANNHTRGVVRPADFAEKIAIYAAANTDTQDEAAPLVAYTNALRDGAPELPGEVSDSPEALANDSSIVAQYSSSGGAIAEARKGSALYRALPPSMRARITEQKFVNHQVKSAGYKAQ